LTYLIVWCALWPLFRFGIVFCAKTVHHFVHEVEDAHPQRDPLLLAAFETDKERVEAVRVLVRLDADAVLANAAYSVALGVPAPAEEVA
jgi:hypothetical protein